MLLWFQVCMHSHTQSYNTITLAGPHLHASMREAHMQTCVFNEADMQEYNGKWQERV